ncbi:4-amino-4-deoxy-L-arabinose transferase-like glycosyltransferase OS=Streptomyces griseomycini OX=66895 GN=FHS37_001864 PE=4 SV=1 [Streptomyces griseomycini]
MTAQHDQTSSPADPAAWGPPRTAPRHRTDASAPGRPGRSPVRALWRGRPEDPRWARPSFLGLLLVTGLLYLYDLNASGYANSFYSAAAQAGSQSWKAFFFGSLDAANAITVDKPRPRCGRRGSPSGSSA